VTHYSLLIKALYRTSAFRLSSLLLFIILIIIIIIYYERLPLQLLLPLHQPDPRPEFARLNEWFVIDHS